MFLAALILMYTLLPPGFFCFHPNTYRVVILPDVWSYLAICFPTLFPGPYLSNIIFNFLFWHFPLSDLSGVDLCSSDIWILRVSSPEAPVTSIFRACVMLDVRLFLFVWVHCSWTKHVP